MIRRVRSRVLSATRSEFGRNAIWFTALSAFERIVAVVQTVIIARVLGITEYGVYGFLFGTIGFVASVVGLQMGLTATVYVARYRGTEKAKTSAVIAIVGRFGWAVGALFVVLAAPFSPTLATFFLGSDQYQLPMALGIVFVGATIVSGIQEGVAQGFEIFGALAKIKIFASLLTLAVIAPLASYFGLVGVLAAVLGGVVLRYQILGMVVTRTRIEADIPRTGAGVVFGKLIAEFALPSMAVSLAVGFVTWLGTFLLSRQPAGFSEVAIASTGLQWRGPVLLLAATLGGVAIPAFSKLDARGDVGGSKRLRRNLLLVNLGVALLVAAILISVSGLIMQLYGSGFAEGRLAFAVILLSTVPTVLANVYMQELVGAGRMWRQFWLHTPYLAIMASAFTLLVPRYQAAGYAYALLLGSVVFLSHVLVATMAESRQSARQESNS